LVPGGTHSLTGEPQAGGCPQITDTVKYTGVQINNSLYESHIRIVYYNGLTKGKLKEQGLGTNPETSIEIAKAANI
jgi:hypothetical protein